MNRFITRLRTHIVRTALVSALFCATLPCSAQDNERGIVAKKIGAVADTTERPAPEIRFQLGHSSSVESVAWSPDSRYIVSGSSDCTMKVWDASSGRELRTLTGHSRSVNSVAWSPDGKYITSGSGDCTMKIWDVSSWKELHTFTGHSSYIMNVSWSPNGKYIASGSDDGTIKLWDVSNWKEMFTLSGHSDWIESVSWSPDSKYIVSQSSGTDCTVKVWDAESGKEIGILDNISSGNLGAVAWSPDGKYIASGCGDIILWNVSSGNRIFRIPTQNYYAYSVAWSPDSKYIAAGDPDGIEDSAVRVWNASSGKEILSSNLDGAVRHISWSPNGKYIAIGMRESTIMIWDVTNEREIRTNLGHFDKCFPISWSQDGEYLTIIDEYGKAKTWNISRIGTCKTISLDINNFQGFSLDGRYIILLDGGLTIWDARNGKKVYTLTENPYMSRIVCSLDGKYIAGEGDDGMIDVWDMTRGTKMYTITAHSSNAGVAYVEFSPDGRYIASSGYDDTIKVWNASSGEEMYTLTELTGLRIAWSPDSRYIINSYGECNDYKVIVRDATSGKVLHMLAGLSQVVSVTWSSDGKYIAGGDVYGTIKIWDAFTWKSVHTLKHTGVLSVLGRNMAWSPDSKCIASVSNGGIINILNAQSGTLLSIIINRTDRETSCLDDEWLTYTPEGFFCGSEWATKNLVYIVDGMDVIGIDQVYDAYYRPDLVAAKIRGEDISAYASSVQLASLVRSGSAPLVSLADVPAESSARDMQFAIAIRNTGGGIGAVNLLLNGKAIRLSDGIASTDGETVTFRHTVTLQNGSNTLEAFALNGAGLVESVRANAEVVWRGATEKPDLYVLTVAVNKYRDKSLWLNYAVPDAEAIAGGFQKQKSGLYRNVHISQLNDGEVTKENLASAFSRLSQSIRADDVFVFFVSGHGTTYDDGDYYYLPADFRYTSKDSIPDGGISKNDLLANLSKIKAGKTLVMLDTCNSGAFLSDFGQRGLSEKTAIDRLTRATGHATLAASSDTQAAMEGYNGHGVFTYVLLEGISGAADSDGDGYVTLNELSAFVEKEVPERSYEKWGYEQVPQKDLRRQDFPIAGK